MDFRAWQRAIVGRLDRLLDRKATAKGSRRRLLDAHGLPVAFFGALRRRVKTQTWRIPLNDIFPVIESLGEHPIMLLYEAGRLLDRGLPPLPRLRKRLEELPTGHRVRRFAALLENGECRPKGSPANGEELAGHDTWRRLVRLAQSEPRRALDQGEASLEAAAGSLRPRILATLGTALRRTDDLEGAFAALEVAEQYAQRLNDHWTIADIWQRRCYVQLAAGEPEQALALALAATGKYVALGQLGDAGRAAVDQGVCLAALNRQKEAIQTFQSALEILPPREYDNRFSAMNNISRAFCELGNLMMALSWAKRAANKSSHGVSPMVLLANWETRGLLAFQLGNFREAENAFAHCIQGYGARDAHLDAALSLVWLCRCLATQGHTQKCRQVALTGTEFIGPLKKHRLAAAAMVSLAVEANAGRAITPALLERLIRQLQEIRGWRPIGTPL